MDSNHKRVIDDLRADQLRAMIESPAYQLVLSRMCVIIEQYRTRLESRLDHVETERVRASIEAVKLVRDLPTTLIEELKQRQ